MLDVPRILAIAAMVGAAAAGPAEAQQPVTELTAVEIAAGVRAGTLRSRDVVGGLLAAAEARRGLNAFISLNPRAEELAGAAEEAAARGDLKGALHGVPIVVKDNIDTAELPTTAATPGLRENRPRANAPVLQRLVEAGAIVLGKTNMHELAFGITSNNAAFGAVGNAYAPDRFAGGSSGGTGAAIGSRLAPAGLGSDTGGSVRIPAALNGIAGLRPTVGRYPGSGMVPIARTRDTAGPMARTVADLVLLDGVITGDALVLAPASLRGLRLGVPRAFAGDLDEEVARVFGSALNTLKGAGVELVEVDLGDVAALNEQVGFPVALHEARSDLAAYLRAHDAGELEALARGIASPDVRFVFDELILGAKAPPESVYRAAIDEARPKLQGLYARAFLENRVAALVFPTTPLPAQPVKGSDAEVVLNGSKVPTFQTFIRNTDPGSNAGVPGLSVPAGLTAERLPVGLALDGPAGSDRNLLAIGLAIEAVLGRLPAP